MSNDALCYVNQVRGQSSSLFFSYLWQPWLPRWLSGKESACQCRKLKRHGFDPRVPGLGNGNPLQYLPGKIPWTGAWQGTAHGVAKSQTVLSDWWWEPWNYTLWRTDRYTFFGGTAARRKCVLTLYESLHSNIVKEPYNGWPTSPYAHQHSLCPRATPSVNSLTD